MKESVSALVDGEVSELELHRVLKASESDESIRHTWSRYQIISSVLRNDAPSAPQIDLSSAIREAIDAEEVHQMPAADSKRSGWVQNLGKVAVAASVAAVMVLTTQLTDVGGTGSAAVEVAKGGNVNGSPELQLPTPAATLPAGFQTPSLTARTVSSHQRMPVQESRAQYYPVVTKAQSALPAQPPTPEVQAYLQRVMEVHAGHAALNSSRGMMPYARVPADTE
ncbi:sigma-E factor negative regulatory protein [Aestuariicella hydrocarbonica]|uniref:Sigma-E factor negative regulatory protein n=1 Tax=Pseudomaricurvus hydrocarbonicus TaxID=1470433 RepID=A0A9E5JRT7_9GAMM|nr:sigma-E factor negative regulatory protein [Aestuariicella hydrocarbonica]NHO65553.1 sigma-E factor negative regulatory protein [Aestuariicella hydrocarbonica]